MDKVPITILLTSTVVAAIVSGLVGWLMKSVDFRFDYKKYVLKKRIDAYESANLLFNKFYRVGTLKNGKHYIKVLLPDGKALPKDHALINEWLVNYYDSLTEELLGVLSNRIWFSKVFYNTSVTLVNIITIKLLEMEKNDYSFEVASEIVTKDYQEIIMMVEKLDNIYITDISKLSDVKSFIKTMVINNLDN
ncbi:MAG: hypothetical protein ABI091_27070 [Ferruginibacter sp.]